MIEQLLAAYCATTLGAPRKMPGLSVWQSIVGLPVSDFVLAVRCRHDCVHCWHRISQMRVKKTRMAAVKLLEHCGKAKAFTVKHVCARSICRATLSQCLLLHLFLSKRMIEEVSEPSSQRPHMNPNLYWT